ncbi:C40 family peptidase [Rubrivivax gelatinosus]|uniref:Putative C40 family peptidase n=1 Tax=Rubrivivax gelatinosus (strain NBRC 100245 / IL144) TaxID=983917 RepID=I0HUB9_RUBGI|nr:C40 family peptidase [Rubrivivax gelatinosus]MBG6078526.1 cell wall-associated NlpC family hydrolase [Rubrivivax gelatinosus]BAL96606.1 putative C40 family peptidase [Rubrivivax gelatinosus IL144]
MPFRPRLLRLCVAGLAAAAVFGASAAPETPANPPQAGDAVMQLLQQKGFVPSAASVSGTTQGIVQQVRDTASELVMSAMNFLGVPYRRGGNSAEEGFDCSGFTRHVFESSLGMVLPRRADQQAKDGALTKVSRDELKPGDLVFFNTMRRAFSHVGIYIGDGKFIHAPRTGSEVRIEDMRQSYWMKRFNGARRADLDDAAQAENVQPRN